MNGPARGAGCAEPRRRRRRIACRSIAPSCRRSRRPPIAPPASARIRDTPGRGAWPRPSLPSASTRSDTARRRATAPPIRARARETARSSRSMSWISYAFDICAMMRQLERRRERRHRDDLDQAPLARRRRRRRRGAGHESISGVDRRGGSQRRRQRRTEQARRHHQRLMMRRRAHAVVGRHQQQHERGLGARCGAGGAAEQTDAPAPSADRCRRSASSRRRTSASRTG